MRFVTEHVETQIMGLSRFVPTEKENAAVHTDP